MAADPLAPGITFSLEGWVHSEAILAFDPVAAKTSDTGLARAVARGLFRLRVTRVQDQVGRRRADSAFIDHKKEPTPQWEVHRRCWSPTEPTGPIFTRTLHPRTLAWLERGGIVAVAHVRGGGELGEDWHLAGQKLHKENSIRDFITVGQWLVDNKYTSPARLGGKGTGAGGIVVGGALTQRPDLFAAMVSEGGWHNMLRAEFSPTGPANIPEFGTVKEPDGFRALAAVDSYQAVKSGTTYPAILLVTGINDPGRAGLAAGQAGRPFAGGESWR